MPEDLQQIKISEFKSRIAALEQLVDTYEKIVTEQTDKLYLEIDEHKQTENELKSTHAQLLQQDKLASIGQLAAGVAHEINNPLSFIFSNLITLKSYVDRLRDFFQCQSAALRGEMTAAQLTEEKIRLKFDRIMADLPDLIQESLDGSNRVKNIVQSLQNIAQMEPAELVTTDINECLANSIKLVGNELESWVTIKQELGPLPPTKCYPRQLKQVFLNILLNAVHAIEHDGEVIITTWRDEYLIHISIADNGSGIPPEILNRIFEPFFSTQEVGKGTGLGLSIAHAIIKRHNGNITVVSSVGKGTRVTITLPII